MNSFKKTIYLAWELYQFYFTSFLYVFPVWKHYFPVPGTLTNVFIIKILNIRDAEKDKGRQDCLIGLQSTEG